MAAASILVLIIDSLLILCSIWCIWWIWWILLEGFDSFLDDFLHFLADGFQIQSQFNRFSQDSFGLETDSTDLLQDSSDLNEIQTDSTELLEKF